MNAENRKTLGVIVKLLGVLLSSICVLAWLIGGCMVAFLDLVRAPPMNNSNWIWLAGMHAGSMGLVVLGEQMTGENIEDSKARKYGRFFGGPMMGVGVIIAVVSVCCGVLEIIQVSQLSKIGYGYDFLGKVLLLGLGLLVIGRLIRGKKVIDEVKVQQPSNTKSNRILDGISYLFSKNKNKTWKDRASRLKEDNDLFDEEEF